MNLTRKQKIYNLLKGIETGDPESVKVVNETKYIQHNPQTREGGEGLAALFAKLSKTNPKVEIVRLFEDGDYVFGHTIYDFSSVRIGFEIFRYEGNQVVEHWDNIELRKGDMVGGSTEIKDIDLTEDNRGLVHRFMQSCFLKNSTSEVDDFIDHNSFIDHSTLMSLTTKITTMDYKTNYRLLAQGNFVLSVSEGHETSFYDLFRIENNRIVEHWDTTEKVAPVSEWKNSNGKF